ncbi:hypothetical protein QJS04_geneDACA005121 [Acorus gramineus]|uniref:glucose-1-phosphate adenylyltransferase n=1 Tax=Acorus gramineus TaxID=55184 RepID=A0AAV9AW29_ACOGR|nr:hypothetical protein QJS04_geneDACA005121 [Acorus gramineus]
MATMIGTVVDSCNMAFRANTHLGQSQKVGGVGGEGGLWGSSKSSLWGTAMENKLRKKSSVCRAQGGVISSVLADVNKETLTLQAPMFRLQHADPKSVASIILGGGAGTQLFPLTSTRATPAVPLGGCYRLIDVPMSNCINSGLRKVFILTQFNSASLNRHIARTYNVGNGVNFGDGFVEVLAATQTPGEAGKKWFQGTADAVRQFTWVFEKHIYTGADITVSCVPLGGSRASDYGLIKIDPTGRITQFVEKPKDDGLQAMRMDTTILGLTPQDAIRSPYIASMGVYVFKKDILLKLLKWRYPTSNDFGSEIIPAAVHEHNVKAYMFNDYWEDIGTIRSFFDANLALTDQVPKFQFYDSLKPFYTSPRFLPPSKVDKCRISNSIISHGCFLRECSIEHSIVGVRSRLDQSVELQDTVMMGADYYQTEAEIASLLAEGSVPVGVGKNTKIRNCIIDMNAKIGKDVIIANTDGVQEADRPSEGFHIRSGITVILKNSTIKDDTDIGTNVVISI